MAGLPPLREGQPFVPTGLVEALDQLWQQAATAADVDAGRQRLAPGAQYDPGGFSYYLRGNVEIVRRDNAFVTGDAAGLASRDLGEGIGPAIRSGLRSAAAILSNEPYRLDDVTGSSVGSIARSMLGRLAPARLAAPWRARAARVPTGGSAHGLRHGDQ